MAIWRSRLLEDLLGGPLDETGLTAGALQGLCDAAIVENEQLEFKGPKAYDAQHKGRDISWRHEQEFAKDVCAFTNHLGGIILIGVEEGEQGVAGSVNATGRPPAEAEHHRLAQALQQHASPAVRVAFVMIPVGENYATAVIVPPSPEAPHGVSVAPKTERRPLCFPVRDGAHTRYLHEAELADRYHRRFLGAADRRAREDRVVDEGGAALERSPEVWCYVAVVPTVAADSTMNREVATQVHTWLAHVDFESPLRSSVAPSGRPIPSPGRLTFTEHPMRDGEDIDEPRGTYVELHADGAYFGAEALRTLEGTGLHPLHLADAIIRLVEVGLRWSTYRIGQWGTATVVCGLRAPGTGWTLELRHETGGETRRVAHTRRLVSAPVSWATADLSRVATVQDRMVVAYEAGSGLVQHFGLPEMLHLGPDGAINIDAWRGASTEAIQWAKRYDVDLGNSTTRTSPYAP